MPRDLFEANARSAAALKWQIKKNKKVRTPLSAIGQFVEIAVAVRSQNFVRKNRREDLNKQSVSEVN